MRQHRVLVLVGLILLLVASYSDQGFWPAPAIASATITAPSVAPAVGTHSHTHPAAFGGSPASAQRFTTGQTSLPLALDGRTNSEGVPDRIAYYHFIMSAAERSSPTTMDLARRARLSRIGLSPADAERLTKALRGVRDELEAVAASRRRAGANMRALRTQEELVLREARGAIDFGLSADGAFRLASFIDEQVKPNIKIYGSVRD